MARSLHNVNRWSSLTWVVAIALVSATLGMLVAWRAPGLDLYGRDWLMRSRGPLAPPTDIVIVAIDEQSIQRYGRFPWPRSVIARAIGQLAAARPKAIAVDVLFAEPTSNSEDNALSGSISRAGNVVSAAQLAKTDSGEVVWLRPLPSIQRASAAVGHVNVTTELEGVARQLLVRETDDVGNALWAMAIETVRVADGASEESVAESGGAIRVGSHSVPVRLDMSFVSMESSRPEAARRLAPQRMTIDYVGPPGSFGPYTFSISEVAEGRFRPGLFSGKYVLIGATGASLGDRLASPFIHLNGSGSQHGTLMPGVEVLANSLNTILRSRFYSETPEWLAFLCASMVALIATGALSLGHTRYETLKQVSILIVLATLLLTSAYLIFTRGMILPPLVPTLVSFATATPLALLRRSMVASAGLDERVRELARAESWLWPSSISPADPAPLIASLTGASAVAIYSRNPSSKGGYSLAASAGLPVLARGKQWATSRLHPSKSDSTGETQRLSPELFFAYAPDAQADLHEVARKYRLGSSESPSGVLILAHDIQAPPKADMRELCIGLAASYISQLAPGGNAILDTDAKHKLAFWRRLPRGPEWKARALGILHRSLLARARFVDRAIRSVEDGLIVGGLDGRIVFVNPRATEILGVPEASLLGTYLLGRLGEKDETAKETLSALFKGRGLVEREITFGTGPQRRYTLRLSPVLDDTGGRVMGMVASLSDITRQHELQQMKTDVMALVTHELRTPVTAIQGISELLTQFEVDPKRQREMHAAIHDEAKRLSRMIDEYLDITKLESGVRPLRPAPVKLESIVERALLLLDPLAARRGVTLTRQFGPSLPPVLVDADLLARAVTNLAANAIKYSPVGGDVTVSVRNEGDALLVEVSDDGCGISQEHLGRIFEKFYRVPRIEDVETPGTGLGLTMVREIMDLHGGAVNVKSTLGAGSTFSLRLPLAPKTKQGGGLSNDG